MYELSKMTWCEIKDIVGKVDALIMPLGSVEQHGYHLPINNDAFIAEALAKEIAILAKEKGMNLAVGVTISLGLSQHHMNFCGSLTLSKQIYQGMLKEVLLSYYQHGFNKIFIINGHGGNAKAIIELISDLQNQKPWGALKLFQYWEAIKAKGKEILESDYFFHADEGETSLAMALNQRVNLSQLTDSADYNKNKEQFNLLTGEISDLTYIDELSPTGVVGNSKKASHRKGVLLLDIIKNEALSLLKNVAGKEVF